MEKKTILLGAIITIISMIIFSSFVSASCGCADVSSINGSGDFVDHVDKLLISKAMKGLINNSDYDINGDGVYNLSDMDCWFSQAFRYTPYNYVNETCDGLDNDCDDIIDEVCNSPPILDPIGNFTIEINETIIITLNYTEPNNDNVSFDIDYSNGSMGNAFNYNVGVFEWTPRIEHFNKIYNVIFYVSDAVAQDSERVYFTVNQKPIFNSVNDNYTINETENLQIYVNASDMENNSMYFNATNLPNNATFNNNTQIFNWTPGYFDSGNYSIIFYVNDGYYNVTKNVSVFVNNNNRLPVFINVTSNQPVLENNSLIINVNATDHDLENITYYINDTRFTNYNNGTFYYDTTFTDSGNISLNITISDGLDNVTNNYKFTILNNNLLGTILNNFTDGLVLNETDHHNLTLNVTNPDNDTLTYYYSINGSLNYSYMNSSTGFFELNTSYFDSGVYQISFYVNDSEATINKSLILTVNNVNRIPFFNQIITNQTVFENNTLDLSINASDDDLETLTYNYSITGNYTNLLFNTTTGVINLTPDFDDFGVYNFTVFVTDGSDEINQTFILTVNNTNRLPTFDYIINDTTMTENSNLVIDVNATDLDGQLINYSYSINDTLSNISIDNNTGVLTINTDHYDSGSYLITLFIDDSESVVNQSFILNVTNVNQLPTFDYSINDQVINESSTLVIDINATDLDGQLINYSYIINDTLSNISIDNNTGALTINTDHYDSGSYLITLFIDDSEDVVNQSFTLNVTNVNQAPYFGSLILNQTVFENNTLDLSINASDDDLETLTYNYSITGNYTNLLFNTSTGVINLTPDFDDSGVYNFTVFVTDGSDEINQTFILTVNNTNRVPSFDQVIGNLSIDENSTLIVDINATDLDNDTLTYHYLFNSTVSNASINSTSGVFSFTPAFNESGSYTVVFYVSDGNQTNNQTSIINVTNLNRAPEFGSYINNITIDENSYYSNTVNATDLDGETISYNYSLSGSLSNFSFNNNTGFFEMYSQYNESGNYTITFYITDGSLSANYSTNLEIVNVNRVPIINNITGNTTIYENQTMYIYVNATELDSDQNQTLYYSYSSAANLTDIGNGTFTWTPGFFDAGNYSVNFYVNDSVNESTRGFSFTVLNYNRAPVINEVSSNSPVDENSTLIIFVNATEPDNENITYYVNDTKLNNPNNGTFTWTPGFFDAGNHTFTFIVSDEILNDTYYNYSILVNDVNRAPIINSITNNSNNNTFYENESIVFFVNATDIDGQNLTYSINDSRFNNSNNGTFTWTPYFNESGNYSVLFNVSDGVDNTLQVINFTVTHVNLAPEFSTISDQTLSNETTNWYINVSNYVSDYDNDNITYSVDNNLPSGNLTINSTTGIINYTIAGNNTDQGIHDIVITADDGVDNSTYSVQLTITNINENPSITLSGNNGDDIYEGDHIRVNATIDDEDNNVNVQLYDNGVLKVNTTTDFLEYDYLTNNTDGDNNPTTHNITVNATDSTGKWSSESKVFYVYNKRLPNLLSTVINPSDNNRIYSSNNVNITMTFDKNVTNVSVEDNIKGPLNNLTINGNIVMYTGNFTTSDDHNLIIAATQIGTDNTETYNVSFSVDLTGNLTGTVRDSSSNPITGATVNVYNMTGSLINSTTTLSDGTFLDIINLDEGQYIVNVSKTGIVDYITSSQNISIDGQGLGLDVTLYNAPDVSLSSNAVSVSPEILVEGQNVLISAIVNYTGESDINSTVRLLIDNGSGYIQADNQSINLLDTQNSYNVNFNWVAVPGNYDIKVRVDNLTGEVTKSNNDDISYSKTVYALEDAVGVSLLDLSMFDIPFNYNYTTQATVNNFFNITLYNLNATLRVESGVNITSPLTQYFNLTPNGQVNLNWNFTTGSASNFTNNGNAMNVTINDNLNVFDNTTLFNDTTNDWGFII